MLQDKKISKPKLWSFSNKFCNAKDLSALSWVLHTPTQLMKSLAIAPVYQDFDVPKKSGGFRHIENPEPALKSFQKNLNFFLQATYHFQRTDAVYGFVTGCELDKTPRNILTNAVCHQGKAWMFNLDFKDFFHQISYNQVVDTFESYPFGFSGELSHTLAQLTTYKGRLPMGAATSPVLSNFACRSLDYELLSLAKQNQWVFTRYADDLSFSSDVQISETDICQIKEICEENGFPINPDKEKLFTPDEIKLVTGLQLKPSGPDLADDFLPKLHQEIIRLQTVCEVKFRNGKGQAPWLNRYYQRIRGGIEFVKFVRGEESDAYKALQWAYHEATNPQEHYDPTSWLDFGYC